MAIFATSGISLPIARIIQSIICAIIGVADLNHIQNDSKSDIINIGGIFPEFIISTTLPVIYGISWMLALSGFIVEIILVFKRKFKCRQLFPMILWFVLSMIHCLPDQMVLRLLREREDLYILQLAGASTTFLASIFYSAVDVFGCDQANNPTSSDAALNDARSTIQAKPASRRVTFSSKRSTVEPPSSSILHGVRHRRNGNRVIDRRRYNRRIGDSPDSVRKLLTTMKPSDATDDDRNSDEYDSKCVDDQESVRPATFQATVPSDSASCISDIRSNYSSSGRSPSIIGSVYSMASSRTMDIDSASVFSSSTQRYAPSTVFSSSPSSMQTKAECNVDTPKEWPWKILVGTALLFSVSTNIVVLGYFIRTRREA